jgi:N-acetylglucosamine kinase-like BadF-type ATPase
MSGEYFLGVDGGQSSTTAMIGDRDGRIAGWADAGPCNHVSAAEARAKFLRVIRECVSQASAMAGNTGENSRWSFESACLGMSGGPDDKSELLGELIDAKHRIVTHDAAIALAGATSGQPGIVVISGTGSIAFGQNARGETARAGGWGYVFGDEGSAFDIVRQALRAVLREHEGWGGKTALMPALLEATHTRDSNELLHRFYTPDWPRHLVAELAQVVDQIAGDGDPIAAGILRNAAHDLAVLAGSIRSQLWKESERVRVAWVGGAFRSETLLERFRSIIGIEANNDCAAPDHGPAVGALLLAYRAAGLHNIKISK